MVSTSLQDCFQVEVTLAKPLAQPVGPGQGSHGGSSKQATASPPRRGPSTEPSAIPCLSLLLSVEARAVAPGTREVPSVRQHQDIKLDRKSVV